MKSSPIKNNERKSENNKYFFETGLSAKTQASKIIDKKPSATSREITFIVGDSTIAKKTSDTMGVVTERCVNAIYLD